MKQVFRSTERTQGHGRSNLAFIIEMLVLLAFVAGCLAILIQMFAYSHEQGVENGETVKAIHLASNTAESFCADPTSVPEVEIADDLIVYTTVTREPRTTGSLYEATIEVFALEGDRARSSEVEAESLYRLETARYLRTGDA